jgi:two-component system cell cycle sensor histidine kinase/response regulator CckA
MEHVTANNLTERSFQECKHLEPTTDRHFIILIVDDDALIRNLLQTALQGEYEILLAANGTDALQLSRSRKGVINLLLSDIETPGMGGLTLYRQLRRERPELKVFFVSGTWPEVLVESGGGPMPFLRKPFDVYTLRARLKVLLGGESRNGTCRVQ